MSTRNYEQLLQFLYRVPVGLMEVDAQGEVRLMNAYATSLLMPISNLVAGRNLFDILEPYAPDLPTRVGEYQQERGTLVSNRRVALPSSAREREPDRWYSFTIERLGWDSYMVAFNDVTDQVLREQQLTRVSEQEAEQRGRMEIAGSVLHDIGNAVSGLSTYVSRMMGDTTWREITELKRLSDLLDTEAQALDTALGAERREALSTFLAEIISKLEERGRELRRAADDMAQALDHVSETLALQRQYAQEWVSEDTEPVNVVRLVEDAVAMQLGGFEKRGVSLRRHYPGQPVLTDGDRTKLVRVFINLLKNALESFDEPAQEPSEPREIRVQISQTDPPERRVVVTIADNGAGFAEPPESLYRETRSSDKPGGSGMGLFAAKRIIEAHDGTLTMTSAGVGHGVSAEVTLPGPRETGA